MESDFVQSIVISVSCIKPNFKLHLLLHLSTKTYASSNVLQDYVNVCLYCALFLSLTICISAIISSIESRVKQRASPVRGPIWPTLAWPKTCPPTDALSRSLHGELYAGPCHNTLICALSGTLCCLPVIGRARIDPLFFWPVTNHVCHLADVEKDQQQLSLAVCCCCFILSLNCC